MSKRLAGLTALILGLAVATAAAAAPFTLPDDARKLIPADPAAIVAVTSMNEMVDEIIAIVGTFEDDKEMSREDILDGFADGLGEFMEVVDLDRPTLLASGLPDLMSGGPQPLALIIPLKAGTGDISGLETGDDDFITVIREGSYCALAMDPAYAPGGASPDLAAHLPAGVIAMTLDLEQVVLNFRPFIEMGLAGIPTRPADAAADSVAGFTPEEAAALAGTVRSVLESAKRLDLALGRRGDLVTWHVGLDVLPGTALDPGPQPAFARALALTAALPAGGDIHQVIALDQTRMFAAFRDYYILTMRNALSGMGPDQADRYQAWVEQYLGSMDLWAAPMAASLRTSEAGMAVHAVLEPTDAEDAMARYTAILAGVTDLDIGYTLTPGDEVKVAGATFRTWTIGFDVEQFEAVMPDDTQNAMTGTERMQAEQMVAMLRKIMPTVYLGAHGGRLFLAAADGTAGIEHMLRNAGKGRPIADVQRVADLAGPHCQQVVTGDLLNIIKWVTDVAAEMAEEEKLVFADNPIPFEAYVTVDGTEFGFEMGMDLPAMGRLAKAMEAMED